MGFLVRSGLWVGACAIALLGVASRSLRVDLEGSAVVAVFLGTVGVYGFDRWWVDRSGRPWWILPVAGAVGAGLLLPTAALVLLGGVGGLAVLHAWLRRIPWLKPVYIAVAWLAVVVGLPWLLRGGGPWPHVALPIALGIVANVLGCDAVDREAEAAQIDPGRVWWIARAVAALGVVVGIPDPAALIPGALLVAMVRWPVDRWWAERGLDGALLIGSLAALAL